MQGTRYITFQEKLGSIILGARGVVNNSIVYQIWFIVPSYKFNLVENLHGTNFVVLEV
jgi:hypothetical protein